MLRIGEFARLGQVSVKTLHHYDDIGLLQPEAVDPRTGYRQYTAAQLADLNRILALRDLGFSLREITVLVEGPPADLAGALAERRKALDSELADLARRRANVEARLALADPQVVADLVVRPLPGQLVAGLRAVVPPGGDVNPLFVELEERVLAHGARAAAPPLLLHHGWRPTGQAVADVEVVVPLTNEIPRTGRVQVRRLPPVRRALCIVHRGPYAGLARAHQALVEWLRHHRDRQSGSLREVFLRFAAEDHLCLPGPFLTTRAEEFVTEYQLPV